MAAPRSLKTRLILRSVIAVIFVAGILFIPAGSFRYWQGWVFMALLFVPMPITSVYFLKRDPQLVERRLRTEEQNSAQKTIIRWAQLIVFASLLIPGLDYRIGWSAIPCTSAAFSCCSSRRVRWAPGGRSRASSWPSL